MTIPSSSEGGAGSFSWEVLLPERGRAQGSRASQASVRLRDDVEGTTYLNVPVPVARLLRRRKRDGELVVWSAEDLRRAVDEASRTAAFERIAALVTRRDYATREVRDKLLADGFSREVVREAVSRAVDAGLVSDARYADVYIRSKVYAGWGMERIARELSRKGIEASEVEGWPYEYLDPSDELSRALELARRKTVREPNATQKLARFLVGRGFSYGVAFEAARTVREDESG